MNNSDKNILSSRIIYLRKLKGLSQYALAEKLGYSRGLISNYEQGRREPDYNTLKTIASFFDVSTDYLLGNTESTSGPLENNSFSEKEKGSKHLDISDLNEESIKALEDYLKLLRMKELQERNSKNNNGNFSIGN